MMNQKEETKDIKELLKELNQTELAEMTGVSQPAISQRVKRGGCKMRVTYGTERVRVIVKAEFIK